MIVITFPFPFLLSMSSPSLFSSLSSSSSLLLRFESSQLVFTLFPLKWNRMKRALLVLCANSGNIYILLWLYGTLYISEYNLSFPILHHPTPHRLINLCSITLLQSSLEVGEKGFYCSFSRVVTLRLGSWVVVPFSSKSCDVLWCASKWSLVESWRNP